MRRVALFMLITAIWGSHAVCANEQLFRDSIAPILQRRCLGCHNANDSKGELSLESPKDLVANELILPGDAANSRLVEAIVVKDGKAEMPQNSDPLSATEIADIRKWIDEGAAWPADLRLGSTRNIADDDWWSLQPLMRCLVPKVQVSDFPIRNPIDAFVAVRMSDKVLYPASPADRRTLARRVYFDLIGLPPTPEEMESFLRDKDSNAYENLVDRLLASDRYGERWARHWLDVVHYGDTHGYDKDKLRPNAWPYRDYVIRSLNEDTPYDRFVKEQLAGDVLYSDDPRLIAATGFIAAGPWDFIGHVEVSGDKKDGRVARNLDRDDMVVNTVQTFCSVTVGCARCHNHKFDPITQEDYYRLQSVFAAIGRKDRPYDVDPGTAKKREMLLRRKDELESRKVELDKKIAGTTNPELEKLDGEIEELRSALTMDGSLTGEERSARFGYHSQVAVGQDEVKWVQVDLGKPVAIDQVVLFGADEYGWTDFGFPHRFKIEASNEEDFATSQLIADRTVADYPRPGGGGAVFAINGDSPTKARFVRVTATKLWSRRRTDESPSKDWIFALGELAILSSDEPGENASIAARVTSLDSIQAAPRWARSNLTDGVMGKHTLAEFAKQPAKSKLNDAELILSLAADPEKTRELDLVEAKRKRLFQKLVPLKLRYEAKQTEVEMAEVEKRIAALPQPSRVYAAATHFDPEGNHKPTSGVSAPIYVLNRGDIDEHLHLVGPGTLRLPSQPKGVFELPDDHAEGDRRVALANWIVDQDNPLTWRSIVNRIWQYHFGRGIVESPNDFGRMGRLPSHPDLLDWLAFEFRDGGEWIEKPRSLKALHRLMVTSSTYRQASTHNDEFAEIDGGNQYLWRFGRRRLEAEAIRDSVLSVAGKMKTEMYGPGFRDFVLEQTAHSPQFVYAKYDPDDESTHRRSVYRFLPRSQPQPFMETLDCADPSQQVAKRDETVTPLSALALLNNQFMVRMAEHFAARLEKHSDKPETQIDFAFRLAVSRLPTDEERTVLVSHADEHGLASACRVVLNLNEVVFVD